MKQLMLIASMTLLITLSSSFIPETVAKDPCTIDNNAFTIGEEVSYNIYYKAAFMWVKAGKVDFTVEDLGDIYKITAKGYTLPFYDKFYTVRDHYETHIDKQTLLPRVFIRDVNEGDYSLYDHIVFDHENGTATTTRKQNGEESIKEGSYETCVQDMLSILYYMRNMDIDSYDIGDKIPVNVFHENRTYDLKMNYTSYDPKKKLKGTGKVKAFEIKPDLIKNYIISDDHNMSVWVSDDENKLPLEIDAKLTVGRMKAVMSSYSGLRYKPGFELKPSE